MKTCVQDTRSAIQDQNNGSVGLGFLLWLSVLSSSISSSSNLSSKLVLIWEDFKKLICNEIKQEKCGRTCPDVLGERTVYPETMSLSFGVCFHVFLVALDLSWGTRAFSSCPEACGVLVPWPWIQPVSPCIGRWILNHWTTSWAPLHFSL